jgi:two-component system chemotaxis sensor kinase CheA
VSVENKISQVTEPVDQPATADTNTSNDTKESPMAEPTARRETARAASKESTLRVGVEKVDQIINLVGELVITQAMLVQTASSLDPVVHDRLLNGIEHLERNARDLQEAVMSIRMMPMDYVFSRFPRVVRESAAKLGKQIRLTTKGQATELDKSLIERIIDPLTHLVRNSIDHGIEAPDVRVASGKSAEGNLILSAQHLGGQIVIEVADDGGGLSRERILKKAIERGLPVSENTPDEEVWQLIFAPGFSTAEKVTEISGRGVGMDVVRRNIQDMGGHIQLSSRPGQGTTTRIFLPLTLAILDGMSVQVGQEIFVLPLSHVTESLQPSAEQIHHISQTEQVLHVRGEYLPLVALHDIFNVQGAQTDINQSIAVILQAEESRFALLVDHLVGQQQVVVKNLEANYRKIPGISAATILGDGSVALIVDVFALMRMTRSKGVTPTPNTTVIGEHYA